MGRELKRVPLNFNWPHNQIWKGYLNPYTSQDCKACDCSGYNPATKKISEEWYSFGREEWEWIIPGKRRYNKLAHQYNITQVEVDALVRSGRLRDLTENGNIPTVDQVNEWAKIGLGHDGINHYICIEARAKELGVYGLCEFCHGEGRLWQSDEIKKLAEEWKPIEPPKGKGFQLWETTSEGSPCSPVFKTLDALCEWCADNATTFASFKATKNEWRKMLDADFVCHKVGNNIFI